MAATRKGQAIRALNTGTATLDAQQQKTACDEKLKFESGFDAKDADYIVSLAYQKLTAQTKAASISQVLYDQRESAEAGNIVLYYMALRCPPARS